MPLWLTFVLQGCNLIATLAFMQQFLIEQFSASFRALCFRIGFLRLRRIICIYLCFCFMGCFWENPMGKFCSTIFIHLSKTDFVQITRRLCLFFSDISESLIWSRGFFPNGILGNFLNISVQFVRGQKKVPLKVEFNYMEIFHKSDDFYITTTTVELRNKNVNFQFFPPTTKFEMVH